MEGPGDHVGLRAPHGPDYSGDHDPIHTITANERDIFDYLLRPDDMYTPAGVYWADLPFMQRVKFIWNYDKAETAREFGAFWRMFKADPLSPVGWYARNAIIPGAGLGLEGYVLFSIGNIKALFQNAYPACWKGYTVCTHNWISAVDYMETIGIIVGQVLVGFVGDWLGRRWGLIQDAAIMFIGLIMLTAAWGVDLQGWVICYAFSLFFYSIGVGGEYPMTATSGMENAVGAGKISTREDRLHRGRKVTTAFLMQGWGQMANQVILILGLIIFNSGSGNPPYATAAIQATYRVSFAIPAIGTLWLVYYRVYKMKAASRQLQVAKAKQKVTGYDTESLRLTVKYFGWRVVATAGGWFCNDVFFYGNKLFQNEFLTVINGGKTPASVLVNWEYNLINIAVSLVGYYLASFMIDNKLYGRKMMQQVGFFACFLTLVIPAFNLGYYTSPDGVHKFQALYFLSSFFNQFGPNAVTFLVAAEVFPTPIRATAHGFSAAWGKVGALLAAVLYNYITIQQIFYFVPWFGLAGMLVTLLFLPDTTGLDLKEQERRWHYIRTGRGDEYHGIAIHPQHLSLYERWRGVGRNYDANLDYKQKIEEMRGEWEEEQEEKAAAELRGRNEGLGSGAAAGSASTFAADHDSVWTDDVHSYYKSTKSPEIMAKEKDFSKEKGFNANDDIMGENSSSPSGSEKGEKIH